MEVQPQDGQERGYHEVEVQRERRSQNIRKVLRSSREQLQSLLLTVWGVLAPHRSSLPPQNGLAWEHASESVKAVEEVNLAVEAVQVKAPPRMPCLARQTSPIATTNLPGSGFHVMSSDGGTRAPISRD